MTRATMSDRTMADRKRPGSNKTQHVYDYVMERIVDGAFPAGTALNIGTLAEATGVSLIPTREALRRLESEGLIEFVFHRGVRVRELGIEEYREIMQVQAVLEGLAVGMSAPLMTAEDLAQAREANRRMNEAYRADDFHAYNEGSLEFHGLLRARCPNRHLRDTLDRGQSRVAAVRASVVGYRGTLAVQLSDEHEHLLDRIAAGAPAAEIEMLMRTHREGTIAGDSESLLRGARSHMHGGCGGVSMEAVEALGAVEPLEGDLPLHEERRPA